MRNNNLNNNNYSNSHSNYKINDEELNWFTVSLTKYYLTNNNNNNEYNQTSRNMPTKLTNPNDSFDKLGRQFTELARDVLKNYSIVERFGRKDLYSKKAFTPRTAIKTHLSPPTSSSSSSASSTSSNFNTPVTQHRRQKKSIATQRNNNNTRLEELNTRRQVKQPNNKSMTIHISKTDKVKEQDSSKVKTTAAAAMATPQSSTDSLMSNTVSIECHTPQVFNHPSEPIINRDKLKKSPSSSLSSPSASSASVSSIPSPTSTSKSELNTEKLKSTDNEKCQTKTGSTDFDDESTEIKNEDTKDKQKAKASSSTMPSSSTTTPVSSAKSTHHQSRRNHQHQTYQFVVKSETSSTGQTKQNKSHTAYCDNETLNSKSSGIGFYRILNTVGSGNFSQVKSAMHVLTKERVAIKVLDKSRMDASTRRLLSREISILESLHHPNIIRLYEVIETLTRLNLVMEYVAGGDLNRRIVKYGKLSEPEGRIVFAQLIAAVNHLHERNIIHRDIKAENILFTYNFQNLQSTQSKIDTQDDKSMKHNNNNNSNTLKTRSNLSDKIHKLLRHRSHSSKSSRSRDSPTKGDSHHHHQQRSSRERNSPQLAKYATNLLRNQQYQEGGNRHKGNLPTRMYSNVEEGYAKTKLNKLYHQSESVKSSSYDGEHCDGGLDINGLCPDHYRVKLVDFGFSKLTKSPDQQLTTFCGSPAYAAPELFESQSYRGGPVDMWALGIVLFFMLTGLLPFRGSTVGQVRRLVLDNCGLQPPDSLSPAAADLYRNLTARLPETRPTASQLIKYAQYARKDLSPIEISLRQRSTWTSWLTGQTFPKPLPRFKHCPPLPSNSVLQPISSTSDTKLTNSQTDKKQSLDTEPSTTNQITSNSKETPTTSESTNQQSEDTTNNTNTNTINTTSENDLNKSVVHDSSNRKSCGKLIRCHTISRNSIDNDEIEAAKLLLNLGITTEEIKSSYNYESRSAVTGAYRIMLHKIHRSRRLSRLDHMMHNVGSTHNNEDNSTRFKNTLSTIKSSTSPGIRNSPRETESSTTTTNNNKSSSSSQNKDPTKRQTFPQSAKSTEHTDNSKASNHKTQSTTQKLNEKPESRLCHLI
ncbi:unnamed protein product [Trichobilharzia szidati]|nr:unnamed protein product [Trichobilharzia szidati]